MVRMELQSTREPGGRSILTLARAVLASTLVLGACGGGTAAASGGGGGGGGTASVSKSVASFEASGLELSPAKLDFFLAGPAGGSAKITAYYQVTPTEGIEPVPPQPATTSNSDGDSAQTWKLTTGEDHTLFWAFDQADGIDPGQPQAVRLWVQVGKQLPDPEEIEALVAMEVGNAPPVISSEITVPTEEWAGDVSIPFELTDSSADPAWIVAEFRREGESWQLARPVGSQSTPEYALQNLATGTTPQAHVFVWESTHDLLGEEERVSLRLTPVDFHEGEAIAGTPRETAWFDIDNNAAPAVELFDDSFFIDSDTRHGVRVPFRVTDLEGDRVRVVLQWRRPGADDSYSPLGVDVQELEAILADPGARRALRLGTELTREVSGRVGVLPGSQDPLTQVTLPDLPLVGQRLLASGMAGRDLEVLRPWLAPRSLAEGWIDRSTVQALVGAEAMESGTDAWVLQSSGGSWSLRSISMTTGAEAPPGLVAQGPGQPLALSSEPDGQALIVATGDGSSWALHRIVPTTGKVVSVGGSDDGSVPLAPLRGLLALGAQAALVTVDDSLVRIKLADPDAGLAARATVLREGLASPHGLALDPRDPSQLILAQTLAPGPGVTPGRLSIVDLHSYEMRPLPAVDAVGGNGTPSPTHLATEAPARLLVVTDSDPGDGERELVALDLGATAEGRVTPSGVNLPVDAASLAAGPAGLRLIASPGAGGGDLFAGGGVLLRGEFAPEPDDAGDPVPFDPATSLATLSEPLPMAPPPGATWRMAQSASLRTAGAFGSEGTFVWNVEDVPGGGEVVIRMIPFDTDLGAPSDLLIPKAVDGDLHTTAETLALGTPDLDPSDVLIVDADGDGLSDLAFSAFGTDRSLGVMFQQEPGVMQSDATSPVRGQAASDLAVADFDGNGLLDLAGLLTAPSIVVHRQAFPRIFEFQPWSELQDAAHLVAPTDFCAADLDDDGRPDLAVVDFLTSRATVYMQGGLDEGFPAAPDMVLGSDGQTSRPAAIEAADLDGDGRLDLVVAATNSNALALFRQLTAGGFPTLPDELLTGPVAPAELAVGDIDRDGLVDLIATIDTKDSLGLWFQHPDGTFTPSSPDQTLTSATFNPGGSSIQLVDFDGDGRTDILAPRASSGSVVVHQQDVEGSFPVTSSIELGLQGGSGVPLRVGNLGPDGRPDLVWAGSTSNLGAAVPDASLRLAESPQSELLVTDGVRDLNAADLDGDGLLDLVAAVRDADVVAIWIQSFLADYAEAPTYLLGSSNVLAGPTALVTADLDGDGRCDIVSANAGDRDLAVFLQDLSGNFPGDPGQRLADGPTTLPQDIAAADIDADGDLDLISANAGPTPALLAYAQLSAGTFDGAAAIRIEDASLSTPQRLVASDVDLDGRIDLCCSDLSASTANVFLQPAGGWLGAQTIPIILGGPAETPTAYGLRVADLDGDRRPDLLLTSVEADDVSVFLGRNTGPLFGESPQSPDLRVGNSTDTNEPRDVALMDFDRDGRLDLLVPAFRKHSGDDTPNVAVFRQVTAGVFETEPMVTFGDLRFPIRFVTEDLDGDGDPDLAIAGATNPELHVRFGGL
jgi:hypothetical protein